MRTCGGIGMRTAAAAFMAAGVLLASGCGGGGGSGSADKGGGSPASGGSGPTNAAEPTRGGTLRIADEGEALTLDPFDPAPDNNSVHVYSQIIETLYRTDAKGEVIPWLVASSEPSEDFRTWTLGLREGVKFSDGQAMTADDVVFSLNTARKNPTWKGMFDPIAEVRDESPLSVVITTKTSFPGLDVTLSLFAAGIVPKDFGGKSQKQFKDSPVGTGPFKLDKWDKGQSLTLVRNENYWEPDRPYLDEVVFQTLPDNSNRALELRGGQLDLIATPAWAQLASLDQRPGLAVGKFAMAYPDLLVFNVRSGLFADPRVREAVDLAVDREGIVQAALSGEGEPGGAWFPPALRFHDDSIQVSRDPDKAKELMAAAVEDKGVDPTFSLLVASGDTYARNASQIIQENLEEVGFKVQIDQQDSAAVFEQLLAGKFDASLFGITSDIVEPSEVVAFYKELSAFFTGAETDEVDRIFDKALTEPDDDARGELYAEMQQLVANDRSLITLDYRPWVWAMKDTVAGYDLPPTGIPWLADVGFSE
jgi:peptide/nickel transport system substrate-binding protein